MFIFTNRLWAGTGLQAIVYGPKLVIFKRKTNNYENELFYLLFKENTGENYSHKVM